MTDKELYSKTHYASIIFSMDQWASIYASVACFHNKFRAQGNEEIANELSQILEKINETMMPQ